MEQFRVRSHGGRSRWRREILMLGGNPIAARYAGIPVARRIDYVLRGLLFVGGVWLNSREKPRQPAA